MNAFLWSSLAFFIAAFVLSAIAYYTAGKKMRIAAMIACAATGLAFLIGWLILDGTNTLWWFAMPLIFAAAPVFLGSMVGAFAKYIRNKVKNGFSTGMKILCVILLLLSAIGLAGVINGIIQGNRTGMTVGAIVFLVFMLLGVSMLMAWKKK